ncbi:MAG: PilZ domain-containing protein [Candidatus Omnitrophica bacterium]|nr:PilZ domain-containing protein [Candidatus Omnitrophota bacterium]
MDNKRRLVRLDTGDFLEVHTLNEVGRVCSAKSRNFSLMGVCFSCQNEWQKGQVLLIDYFIPDELDSVRIKMVVVWSEFIGPEVGYFCGGEILDVEEAKQEKFSNYYFKKLQDRFFK